MARLKESLAAVSQRLSPEPSEYLVDPDSNRLLTALKMIKAANPRPAAG